MCLFVQNTVYFPLMQFHPVSRAMPMRHEARLHWTVFFYVGQTSWRSGGSATSQRRRFADAGFIQAPCRRSEAESQRSQRLEFFVYAFQTHYSWQGFASSSHSFCSQWPPRQTPTNLSASGRHSKLPLKLSLKLLDLVVPMLTWFRLIAVRLLRLSLLEPYLVSCLDLGVMYIWVSCNVDCKIHDLFVFYMPFVLQTSDSADLVYDRLSIDVLFLHFQFAKLYSLYQFRVILAKAKRKGLV